MSMDRVQRFMEGELHMGEPLLDDELWELIEPLLPPEKPRRSRFPGRRPLGHRHVLTGILFVLKTGIPWEYLPLELGCGSGMTCWRHLRDWQEAGVWKEIHKVLLAKLRGADQIDWSRAIVDSSSIRAVFGGRSPAQVQRTEGNPARNTTSSRMRRAFPSPSRSPGRTLTMSLR
jgi:transposase